MNRNVIISLIRINCQYVGLCGAAGDDANACCRDTSGSCT